MMEHARWDRVFSATCVERVTRSVSTSEIEIPSAGEEVDVGESTVVEDQQSDPQSVPHQFHSQFGSRAS